jgi:hypothetical protein
MWLCGATGPSNEPDFYLRLYPVLCSGLCLHGVEGILMATTALLILCVAGGATVAAVLYAVIAVGLVRPRGARKGSRWTR